MKIHRLAFCVAAILTTPLAVTARGGGGHSGGSHSSGSHHSSSGLLGLGHTSPFVHHVDGYTRRDGTRVNGYMATDPNGTRNDNFSTRGNVNPYTGVEGSKPRDEDPH